MAKIFSASPFHKKILLWYSVNKRSFPWRKTRIPYRILLSEIMAQQTQISRVEVYYSRWLKKFPTFSALAKASTATVLREWSGLGYNSRALRFHKLAKIVSSEFHSRLPQHTDELQKLPGIGRYTAHALCCFAFGKSIPVVDVNVKRVFTRWTKKVRSAAEQVSDEKTWELAGSSLPRMKVYEWNQSLMDLGGLICTARNPKCHQCPVSTNCASAFSKVFLQKEKKKVNMEPLWKGIPRRLHRGKILKLLHHHSFSPVEITASLWSTNTPRDVLWTTSVLEKMEQDGLLSVRNKRYSIAH